MERLPWQGWTHELAIANAWVRELRKVLAKPDPCWDIETFSVLARQKGEQGKETGSSFDRSTRGSWPGKP